MPQHLKNPSGKVRIPLDSQQMAEQHTMSPVLNQAQIEGISKPRSNMAYVNISTDGAKPVGPIGLKKAEKDLIMRRYKYNHQMP